MNSVIHTLEPTGVLDGVTANELKQQIAEIAHQDANIFLLNMKAVTFMNSSGIGALVAVLKMLRAQEKQLYLYGLTDQVRMIFELTKMERVFQVFENKEDFEQAILRS